MARWHAACGHHRRRLRRPRARPRRCAGSRCASRWSIATTTTSSSRCSIRSRRPTLSAGDIGAPIRWVLRQARNVRVLLGDAESVDVAARHVVLRRRRPARLRLPDRGDRRAPCLLRPSASGKPSRPASRRSTTRSLMRRRILLAFERAEREDGRRAARRAADVRARRRRARPASSWRGRWPRSRGRRCATSSRRIDTARARIVVVEAGPSILSSFPRRPARRRAPVARPPGRRGARADARRRHRRARRRRARRAE